MLVKEMIAKLQVMNPDIEVWVSSDGEGNSYESVHYLRAVFMEQEEGYVVENDDAQDMIEDGCDVKMVVCLWP